MDGEGIVCILVLVSIHRFAHPPIAVLLFTHHNDLACAESQLIFPVSIAVIESTDPADQQSVLQAGESIIRPPQLHQAQTRIALTVLIPKPLAKI